MENIYMIEALKCAEKASKKNDVPVGAVAVKNGKIVCKTYNKKNKKNNSILHAEIILIDKLCRKYKNWRLNDIDIYVTYEPCMMCMGALLSSRVASINFGCYNAVKDYDFYNNKHTIINGGIMELECKEILVNFFKKRRNINKKEV